MKAIVDCRFPIEFIADFQLPIAGYGGSKNDAQSRAANWQSTIGNRQ
jgi:hypothetical protein